MSTQGSVFAPSNSATQFQDMMSQSSAPNWAKVTNENGMVAPDGNSKKIMSEINHILSDIKRDVVSERANDLQMGGKRKKVVKKVVDAIKTKAKSKSKKSKSLKRMKPASTKKVKKSSTKKVKNVKSKNSSVKKASSKKRSMKRQNGGDDKPKRAMNPVMQAMRDLANLIKKEIPELADGAPMMSTANKLLKEHKDDAQDYIKKNHSQIKKLYNQILKEQKERKEQKKLEKAKSKAASSDSA